MSTLTHPTMDDPTGSSYTKLTTAHVIPSSTTTSDAVNDPSLAGLSRVDIWFKKNHGKAMIVLILATLLNNIGVQEMGYYMPIHSEFLLYGTTGMYTCLFALTAYALGEKWSLTKEQWIVTAWLGLFTALNGIFAQISIPYVDPEITTIIVQISAPVTWLVHIFMFKFSFKFYHLISIMVILFGLLFGPIYSYFHGSGADSTFKNGIWILITLCSAIPTGFETLYQEKAYRILDAPKFVTLTYYNLFSFFWYFLWSFMTLVDPFGTCVDGSPDISDCASLTRACKLSEQLWHQGQSWQCFFTGDAQCCGGHMSTVWVLIFTIGYYCSFTIAAFILRTSTANTVANVNAVSTPLTSMYFWIPTLSGLAQSQVEWWIIISFVFVMLGLLMYENWATNTKTGHANSSPWNFTLIAGANDGSEDDETNLKSDSINGHTPHTVLLGRRELLLGSNYDSLGTASTQPTPSYAIQIHP